jgi:hypothetical protein
MQGVAQVALAWIAAWSDDAITATSREATLASTLDAIGDTRAAIAGK